MAITKVKWAKGDTLHPLACQLKQKNSTGDYVAVDLTGRTVKFKMVDENEALVVAETSDHVTVYDEDNGKVYYDFQAEDVDTAGTFYAWFLVYDGAERSTFPVNGMSFQIDIYESYPTS